MESIAPDLTALAPEVWLVATIVVTVIADLVFGKKGTTAVGVLALVGAGFSAALLQRHAEGRVYALHARAQTRGRGDSLEAAQLLDQWLEETRPRLPPNISLQVYDEEGD